MKFDTMCRLAERDPCQKWLRDKLRVAALVDMGQAHRADWKPGHEELFRLPWVAVAMEDDVSCCFLQRQGRVASKDIADAGKKNVPIYYDRTTTKDVGLLPGDAFWFAIAQQGDGVNAPRGTESLITYQAVMFSGFAKDAHLGFALWGARMTVWHDGQVKTIFLPPEQQKLVDKEAVGQITVALWQAVRMTQPGTWLCKDTASESRAQTGLTTKKIPRSHQRERWLVITDEQRQKVQHASAKDASQERAQPAAHPRRAHYRRIGTLDNGKPKLTWVRACWVGSPEVEIRGGRYRIETDM